MASFTVSGTAYSFEERGDGGQVFPIWGREADASIEHIPGGNLNMIDYTGLNQDTLTLKARATKSQYDSLMAKVGATGTLVYSYGSGSAFLKAVANPVQLVDSGVYFMDLVFWRQ